MTSTKPEHALAGIPALHRITLEDLHYGLDYGKFSSVDLVNVYLARISEVNDVFRAVIELNPDAVAIANELDEERRAYGRQGPLHGIPVLIKDNMVTLDKMESCAGSTVLLGARPGRESRIIEMLRAAGAIILGKTNLTEWAGWRTWNNTSGWSARFGLTLGAYCENMKSGGSSSGAAVAATLGLAWAAIGSETDGSIVSPSSKACVVGLKPTVGLVPNAGMIPLTLQQDVAGPITRTVKDAAHLLQALVERKHSEPIIDYTRSCVSTELDGLRVGIPRASISSSDNILLDTFESALKTLKSAGAVVVDNVEFRAQNDFDGLSREEKLTAMAGGFKVDIKAYLETLVENPRKLRTLGDVIGAMKSDEREEYPTRGLEQFELGEKVDVASPEYKVAIERNEYLAGEGGIGGSIKAYDLDIIAIPSMLGMGVTSAARGGLPLITVPLGTYPQGTPVKIYQNSTIDIGPNVPFCITFLGNARSEQTLLQVAYAFEQRTKVRESTPLYNPPKTELGDMKITPRIPKV